jgi:crotonobetainyl-CoA:carnitine CoA-transferase CaiB-like acyl-CoA transferase
LIQGLGLVFSELPLQNDMDSWPKLKKIFEIQFLKKTQKEWIEAFQDLDACVSPVLEYSELTSHEHHTQRGSLLENGDPRPAPRLETKLNHLNPSSPLKNKSLLKPGQHTKEILVKLGLDPLFLTDNKLSKL